jgi:hypothetical protein
MSTDKKNTEEYLMHVALDLTLVAVVVVIVQVHVA